MEDYFKHKYGEQCIDILRSPPLESSIRVNTLRINVEDGLQRIQELYPQFQVSLHHTIKDLIIIRASGPFKPARNPIEVYVDFKCGEAVLRGSHIYSPGVLGSSSTCNIISS